MLASLMEIKSIDQSFPHHSRKSNNCLGPDLLALAKQRSATPHALLGCGSRALSVWTDMMLELQL